MLSIFQHQSKSIARERAPALPCRLAKQCGHTFKGGVVLHAGDNTIKLDIDHCLAAPLARLWDK